MQARNWKNCHKRKAEDTDTEAAEDTAAATDEEEAAAASDSKKTSTEKAKDLTEKTKELYEGNVVKYLIVPKDVEIPAGLDKDMIVIQLPVEKTYVASEDALKLLDEQLDAAESIKAVGMEQKDCQIENIAKAMEDKKISFDGAFDDLDYKALVKDEIDFAILPHLLHFPEGTIDVFLLSYLNIMLQNGHSVRLFLFETDDEEFHQCIDDLLAHYADQIVVVWFAGVEELVTKERDGLLVMSHLSYTKLSEDELVMRELSSLLVIRRNKNKGEKNERLEIG